MSNLFIFAIGGTGSRVLRSLLILMASGLKVKAEKIIPIIIDTDSQNEDTNRTLNLLKLYRDIRLSIPNLNDSFFANKIYSLNDLGNEQEKFVFGNSFQLKLPETTNKSFREFISYSFIKDFETKSLLNLLYSQRNLDDYLTKGFLGSPNVGSVVLDSINKTEDFKNFGSVFQPEDRIFIISSIFGGTGAAGFPLLVSNFRQFNPNLTNSNALQNSIIGAITVLPYFKLTNNENSSIDSSSFFIKAISALSYYEENLRGVNALYYIGDAARQKAYNNVEGGESQKNDANFIELAAALAIFDFMNIPSEDLINKNIFKEFAIEKDEENLNFDSLGNQIKGMIAKNLTALFLFNIFKEEIKDLIGSTFMVDNDLDDEFFNSAFYSNLLRFFNDHLSQYLIELKRNTRGFTPFGEVSPSDLSNIFSGRNIPKNFLGRPQIKFVNFANECSKIKSKMTTSNEKFIDMMYKASTNLFDRKLSFILN